MFCGSEEWSSMMKQSKRGRTPKKRKLFWRLSFCERSRRQTKWLRLTLRVGALGRGRFGVGQPMIAKIHAYLVRELKLAENEGEKSAEFVDRMCQTTPEAFWTENKRGEDGSHVGRVGRRMDRILSGEKLPRAHSLRGQIS